MIRLKEILTAPPVLRVAEPDKQFMLQMDALGQGLGAVLSQIDDNGLLHMQIESYSLVNRGIQLLRRNAWQLCGPLKFTMCVFMDKTLWYRLTTSLCHGSSG